MLTVAVTGGIGAGKSTVSRMLSELGAMVVDSDQLAREVVAPGTAGLRAVIDEFGPTVLAIDGSLDRAALATKVFDDDRARRRLEAIIHPRVRAGFDQVRDAAGPDALVVNDIPLLRTRSEAAQFDLVITVAADDAIRIQRLIERGLSEPDARARMAAQMGDDERHALSDVWLVNDSDEAALRKQVAAAFAQRIAPLLEGTDRRGKHAK